MRVAILVVLGVVFGALPALTAIENNMDAANARLGRGVNLGNALEDPKEGAWGVTLQ